MGAGGGPPLSPGGTMGRGLTPAISRRAVLGGLIAAPFVKPAIAQTPAQGLTITWGEATKTPAPSIPPVPSRPHQSRESSQASNPLAAAKAEKRPYSGFLTPC